MRNFGGEEEREGDVFSDFWLRHNVGGEPINQRQRMEKEARAGGLVEVRGTE